MSELSLTVTDDELVKAFTLWISNFNSEDGIFEKEVYEQQYKDMGYPEFAMKALKHYVSKARGE